MTNRQLSRTGEGFTKSSARLMRRLSLGVKEKNYFSLPLSLFKQVGSFPMDPGFVSHRGILLEFKP